MSYGTTLLFKDKKYNMIKLSTITTTVDPILKTEVEDIFKELGLSLNEAINLFFVQVKYCKTLPFETTVPNAETIKTINEARKGIGMVICENEDDMFKKLGI